MDESKGMSQVLALIVAAGVLMMAALTVIALTTQGLGNLGQIWGQSCVGTIETQCSTQGGSGSVTAPNSCFSDGEPTQTFEDSQYGSSTASPGVSVSCS